MSIIHSTETINNEEVIIVIETSESLVNQEQTSEREWAEDRSDVISNVVQQAKGAFSSGVDLVRHCAAQVVTGVQSLDDSLKPEEIEVQLAIKLGSEAGAILVNMSGEAQMQVKLKWKLKKTQNP
jgi:hypothetical protein